MKVTVVPHQQFAGDLVAFVQFKERPPAHLRDTIKRHGGFYRKGPPPFVRHGWHVRNVKSLAKAVEKEFPKLATKLSDVREKLKGGPESFLQKDKLVKGVEERQSKEQKRPPLLKIIKER